MLVRGKLNRKQLTIKPQQTPCRIACITFTIQAEHLVSESYHYFSISLLLNDFLIHTLTFKMQTDLFCLISTHYSDNHLLKNDCI